jgi:hypothetical protein
MGSERVGAPALVDSYRPGAFTMAKFEPQASQSASDSRLRAPGSRLQASIRSPQPAARSPKSEVRSPKPEVQSVVRRFRSPIPARVTLEQGRPVRVLADRRGFTGGKVERCDGPWRSSGDWWIPCAAAAHGAHWWVPRAWNCDEWDVTLSDGASYRVSQTPAAWFIDGVLD